MNEKNGQTLTMGQRLEWKDVGTQHSILTSFPYEKWFNVIYNYYIDRKYCKYNDVLQDSSSLG